MQKGDIPKKGEAGKVAKDMSKKEVDKYAGTKHKGLPKKVKQETMKISDLKKMVQEELQALNEVKPFVDDRMRRQYDYPKGNKDGLVYLATNDKRYPTEIVIYNMNRDVFHFVYSHNGEFKPGSTKTQTVPRKGFNSTHYVMPYFEDWEEDFDYERGFYEGKLNEGKFKVGDIVIPNIGAHKGVKHTIIHDFRDGRYNIQPIGLRPNKIQYRLGAASANEDQLKKVSSGLQQVAPSVMDTSGMSKADIAKALGDMTKKKGLRPNESVNEAKMTPAKVQKAQRELVATIQLLKKNFPMYKAAKESGDTKKLEKHRKIALDLTKKKKQLELALDQALGGLYQDAELELKETKLNETAGSFPKDVFNFLKTFRLTKIQNPFVYEVLQAHFDIEKRIIEPVQEMDDFIQDQWSNMNNGTKAQFAKDVGVPDQVIQAWWKKLGESKLNEAVPKFKTPLEAYKWIMNKRGEAMDIEQEMMDTNAEIQQLYGEMEQEAEAGGGPIADRYGRDIEALEDQHKDLRAQLDMIMAEIDEYDQNY
jgi:hypothetical protein